MCGTCGCGQPEQVIIRRPGEQYKYSPGRSHDSDHEHLHEHTHDQGHGREISLELDIMHKNNLLAERNRGYFEAKNIFCVNMVSSPGSGKTSILERTIKESAGLARMYIIEGDQQTMLDADRIGKAGAPVVQVNTGNGCHLDADMINRAVKKLDIAGGSILMIENVGNLVCPALFDLGESMRVVIISVTEGEDKPLKYANMFQSAQLCLINKSDLLPYVDFSLDKVKEYALRVNHHLDFLTVSAKTGEGFVDWIAWLKKAANM